MDSRASDLLIKNAEKILALWIARVENEISAARPQNHFIIRDSIPSFLSQIAKALTVTSDIKSVRNKSPKYEIRQVGEEHGRQRAQMTNYTIDQLISEYHILRQVIFDVLEENRPLNSAETEIVLAAVEQAVNDAATEFTNTVNKIQETLSAALVHDLRNPIAAVRLYTELLSKRSNDQEFVKQIALKIEGSMGRLAEMIQDLGITAPVAADGSPLTLKTCDLSQIAEQVTAELDEISANPFQLKAEGPTVGTWGENELRRIIENLATNAIKYGTPRSLVTIEVKQTSDEAKLIVHNVGNPIPKEKLETIFNANLAMRSAEKSGWGVGLSVVKNLVTALRGRVTAESSPELGTSFTVVLPKQQVLLNAPS